MLFYKTSSITRLKESAEGGGKRGKRWVQKKDAPSKVAKRRRKKDKGSFCKNKNLREKNDIGVGKPCEVRRPGRRGRVGGEVA